MIHPYVGIIQKLKEHFPEYMDETNHKTDKPIGIICAMRAVDDNDVVASILEGCFLQFLPFEEWSVNFKCECFMRIDNNDIFIKSFKKYDGRNFKMDNYIYIDIGFESNIPTFKTDNADKGYEYLKPYLFS